MYNGCELLDIYDPIMITFEIKIELISNLGVSSSRMFRVDSLMDLYILCKICPKNVLEL
jgi:hypothetical protein